MSTATATSKTKKVPATALTFQAPLEFADEPTQADGKTEAPITLFARAAKAIQHWYWGKIEHDMAGFSTLKETVPIDWCHWAMYGSGGDLIGVADTFDASPKKGLTIGGKLVSVLAEDRADVVMRQGRAGIPFEASIDFNGPMRLEEVGEGMTAEVNGHKFTGPGVIVREWTLRSVAVCPYGVDPNTKSKFSAGQPDPAAEVEVTIFCPDSETEPMAVNQDPRPQASQDPPPAGATALTTTGEASAAADDKQAALRAEAKRFHDAFGPLGWTYFSEGMSFEAAQALFVKHQQEELAAKDKSHAAALAAKDAEIAALKQKLSAAEALRGENNPVSFNDAEKPAPAGQPGDLARRFGENVAKIAGGIKIPGKA